MAASGYLRLMGSRYGAGVGVWAGGWPLLSGTRRGAGLPRGSTDSLGLGTDCGIYRPPISGFDHF